MFVTQVSTKLGRRNGLFVTEVSYSQNNLDSHKVVRWVAPSRKMCRTKSQHRSPRKVAQWVARNISKNMGRTKSQHGSRKWQNESLETIAATWVPQSYNMSRTFYKASSNSSKEFFVGFFACIGIIQMQIAKQPSTFVF